MIGLKVFPPSVTGYAYYYGILYDIFLPCHTKRCPKDACGMQVINLTLLYDGSVRLSPLLYQRYYTLSHTSHTLQSLSVLANALPYLVPSLQHDFNGRKYGWHSLHFLPYHNRDIHQSLCNCRVRQFCT
jgi:hypothetical protein